MKFDRSKIIYEQAIKVLPGGVNSPVRAFKSVGGTPVFINKGSGSKMYDVDGNEFIDYIGSWGPHLFGHNPEFIKNALIEALENGTSFGTPTELEVRVAELVRELVPSIEMIRFVNSGTEATMSAIRLARGYTGRNKIIKFEGCYHGHADYFLIKAGSGALTFGVPTSPGVTEQIAKDTLVATYNRIESVNDLIQKNKNEIAAIIIEPVAGNMGVIPGDKKFLEELRQICDEEKIVLIFDEVMTGFRIARGGAQEFYDIKPDLTTFGKIIGGGLPVGAYGGKAEIMSLVAPSGPIYQAGTLSGNPLAMAAGYAALNYIKLHPEIYDELEKKSRFLEDGMRENLKRINKNFAINRVGSMMTLFFTERKVKYYEDAITSDTNLFSKYFHLMLNQGIYLPPAQFEAFFVSSAHTVEDLEKTIDTQRRVFEKLFI